MIAAPVAEQQVFTRTVAIAGAVDANGGSMSSKLPRHKIRERLQARRTSLLSRYNLERIYEQLVDPRYSLIDMTSEWDARLLSELTDVDMRTLDNVQGALRRLDEGTYSLCTSCGGRIEPARLDALPEAAECIDCVRFAEGASPRWIVSSDSGHA
jgi:DnaK suppressor protein